MVRLVAGILMLAVAGSALAGPQYDQGEEDLEWVMARLKEWLPGAWDSFPQVYYERTVRMPEEGEHEYWHRVFALVDAPQVGENVLYGQINMHGRSGVLYPRTQIVYKFSADEERGAVVMNGQPPADPQGFVDLQDRPELWSEVGMRDESSINCDFLWRRRGDQIFGVLEGKTPDRRKYGEGTCSYISGSGAEFFADAEWVLGPESLWIYDINDMRGVRFIGRQDRTHVRLYRARPYACDIEDRDGKRSLNGYDRGFTTKVSDDGGRALDAMLLRAEYPADNGESEDRLRLTLRKDGAEDIVASTDAEPVAGEIAVEFAGVNIECRRQVSFPPRSESD